MIQRISGYLRGMIALGPLPFRPVLGIVLSCVAADAGMENVRFALDYKPKFVATKAIPHLCDTPATTAIEPNYSPNWNSATTTPNPLPCTSYTTAGPVGAGVVYIVVGRAGTEGVAAASFGVTYGGSTGSGIDPQYVTFTACADGVLFPNNDGVHGDFPQPGGGLRITWNNVTSCQTQVIGSAGVHAVVGSFYIYAYGPDQISITGNNNLQGHIPELAVANCAGVNTDLYQIWGPAIYLQLAGRVDIGGGWGYNPCGETPPGCCPTPSRITTWGRLKSTYAETKTYERVKGDQIEP